MDHNSSDALSGDVLRVALTDRLAIRNLKANIGLLSCKPDSADFHLVQSFAQLHHFRGLAIVHGDGEYGRSLPNGTWTGVIGSVVRQEADIGFGSLALDYRKSKILDYTFPYEFDVVKFFTKSRMQGIFQAESIFFLKPFPFTVWGLLLFYLTVHAGVEVVAKNLFRMEFWIWNISLKVSESELLLRLKGYRFLLLSWLVCYQIAGLMYSSQLTSTTSVLLEKEEINDWKDLAKAVQRRKYFASSLHGTSTQKELEESEDSALRVLAQSCLTRAYLVPVTMDEAFHRLVREKFAFILPVLATRALIRQYGIDTSTIHVSTQSKGIRYKAIMLNKEFLFKEHLNIMVIRLMETGVVSKWQEASVKGVLFRPEYDSFVSGGSMDMSDLRNLFSALTLCHFLALCLWLTERLLIFLKRHWTCCT